LYFITNKVVNIRSLSVTQYAIACDYLGEFKEKMEEFGARGYIDEFVSGGIEKCEFLPLPSRAELTTNC
jgi:hypothetical protein